MLSLFYNNVNVSIGNDKLRFCLNKKEYSNIRVNIIEIIIVNLECFVMVIGYVMGFFFNGFYMIVILGIN